MPDRIIINEYAPEWEAAFWRLAEVYRSHLAGLFSDIQHVGSTSVKGLTAKPIIDIDIIVADDSLLPAVIGKLETLGYEHRGNLGISDRAAFRRITDFSPIDGSGTLWPQHNLYVCPAGSISLRNHLALRDALRADSSRSAAYGTLKKRLAEQFPYDIDRYIEGKTSFITALLMEAGFDPEAIRTITEENRLRN